MSSPSAGASLSPGGLILSRREGEAVSGAPFGEGEALAPCFSGPPVGFILRNSSIFGYHAILKVTHTNALKILCLICNLIMNISPKQAL